MSDDAQRFPACIPYDLRDLVTPDTLFLLNKLDALPNSAHAHSVLMSFPRERTWLCSVQSGERMQLFMDGFAATLRERSVAVPPSIYRAFSRDARRYDVNGTQDIVVTHARHRAHLESALRFLRAFLDMGVFAGLPFTFF